jgi:hypothetical protein
MGRKNAASVPMLMTLPPTTDAFIENVKKKKPHTFPSMYLEVCIEWQGTCHVLIGKWLGNRRQF